MSAMILGGTTASEAADEKEGKPQDGLYMNVGVGAEIEDTEMAWQLNVGYAPCTWFAVEAGYLDLGNTGDVEGGRDGLHIAGQPRIPIADIMTIFGKVGTMISTFGDEDDTVLTYGGGFFAGLPFLDALPGDFEARIEYERYDFNDELHTVMAGLNWYLP
jgi:hypothetical protein